MSYRSPKTNQRLERILKFHLDGTGTASLVIGSGLGTLTDTGTGDYLITFARPFARAPVVSGHGMITAAKVARFVLTTTTAQILTFNMDGTTAADADLYLEITGWDTTSQFSENL